MNPPDALSRCARMLVLALLLCAFCTQIASAAQTLQNPSLLSVPDLSVAKTHAGSFYQGQQDAKFTITVTNTGSADFSGGVVVVDTLPVGLLYKGIVDPQNTWGCLIIPAQGRVECSRSLLLASGRSSSFEIITTVSPNAPASVKNVVDLVVSGDPNLANNHAEDTVVVGTGVDLAVEMRSVSNSVREGQAGVVYTISVHNAGTGSSTGQVSVTNLLPDGLIRRSMSGTGWTCAPSSPTCTRSDPLPKDGRYPDITLTVDVAQDAPTTAENTATVTIAGDINPTNNTGRWTVIIQQAADLTLTKAHDGDFRQGQTDALYRLWVTNTGDGPTISPVTVKDLLPGWMDAVSMEGDGWQCTVALHSCTYNGVLVSDQSTMPILLRVRVAENAPPQVTNYASVSGGGEFNTANNNAADPTNIVQIPDLTVTKTHIGTLHQGQEGAQYTITVSNVGAGPVFGDVLVQELINEQGNVYDYQDGWLTITDLSGLGWECNIIHYNCMREDDIGLLPGRSYPPITATVNIRNQPYVQEVINVVEVSGGGEINTTNNRAEERAVVAFDVDLGIEISYAGTSFIQGEKGAAYRLEVISHGTYYATPPVTVTATLPSSLTATGMSGTDWQCNLSTRTCTFPKALKAGGKYPIITLTVDVAANAPQLVETRARVTASGDINQSNNLAIDQTAVYPPPDLTISISHTGYIVRGKTGSTFSLRVANQGERTRGTVTAAITLPAGLSAASMIGDGWTCSLTTRACTRSDLLHGGFSYPPVLVVVSAAQNLPAQVKVTASVSGGSENNTTNNGASITVPVYTAPSVTRNPQTTPGCLGSEVVFHAEGAGVPAPSIQWQVSGDGGESWADLNGETSPDLRITSLQAAHNGKRYRAVFASIAGEAVSQSAALEVHVRLAFVLHPTGQSVTFGKTVTLQVDLMGSPWVMAWQASPDGAAWQTIAGLSGKTVTFVPPARYDGWQVRASASNACGVVPSQSAKLEVDHKRLYLPILLR